MSKREVKLLLLDIYEACEKIFRFTENMNYSEFTSDDRTSDMEYSSQLSATILQISTAITYRTLT